MTIFGLKMIVKSGLDFFILKLNEPLQRCLITFQASALYTTSLFSFGSDLSNFSIKIEKLTAWFIWGMCEKGLRTCMLSSVYVAEANIEERGSRGAFLNVIVAPLKRGLKVI